uniref:Ficolin-2-like n=1 Tax=Hirondellea gigas TaxID=1518452 RepID=A0A6A7FWP1_9CRUS
MAGFHNHILHRPDARRNFMSVSSLLITCIIIIAGAGVVRSQELSSGGEVARDSRTQGSAPSRILMQRHSHVDDMRTVIGQMASELDRFNTLYVVKLERVLTSTASRLSALESTVRAVADRALAWDNIQNHMAVWTDQSRTMERKLDILNRCHEKQAEWESKLNAVEALNHKLTALDIKINAMTRLEFKVEQISERVEEVDSKVSWLQNHAEQNTMAKEPPSGGVWAEFAGRGILTTLTTIEQNLHNLSKNINLSGSSSGSGTSNHHHNTNYVTSRTRSRVHNSRTRSVRHPHDGNKVQCELQERDTRLLQDVSAKVDLVFDKITNPDEDYDNFIAHLSRRSLPQGARSPSWRGTDHHHKQHEDSRLTEDHRSDDDTTTERIFAMFWRSLFAPFKKLNRHFRSLEGHLSQISRQCFDQSSRSGSGDGSSATSKTTTSTTTTTTAPSLAAVPVTTTERPHTTPRPPPPPPQLTQAQLRLAVAEAMSPLRQLVNNNHLRNNGDFSTIVELIREMSQAVDGSTYRSEEEASKTRELIAHEHQDIKVAIQETQKLITTQCSDNNNNTRIGNRAKLRADYRAITNTANASDFLKDSLGNEVEIQNGRSVITRQNRQSKHQNPRGPKMRESVNADEETVLPLPHFTEETEDRNTDAQIQSVRRERLAASERNSREKSEQGRRRNSEDSVNTNKSEAETQAPFHLSPRFPHRNSVNRTRPTDPGIISRTAKQKRSMGCNDVSATGIVKLPGSTNPNTEEAAYYIRYCDQRLRGGGWTVIQRRGNPMFNSPPESPLNFTRSWDEYRQGFGDLDGEFWWGNEYMHRLSHEQDLSLRFDLWDFDGNYAVAEYDMFRIGNESSEYTLEVSGYRGNASDSFSAHNSFQFSTYDRDNDRAPDCCPCAPAYGGGWWFFSCFESNLNGQYHMQPEENDYYRGLIWELWTGDYSLKATQMSVRPAHLPPLSILV